VLILVVLLCVDELDEVSVECNDEHIVVGIDETDELKIVDEVIVELVVWWHEVSDVDDIKHLELVDIMEVEVEVDGIDDEREVLYRHEVDEVADMYILHLLVHVLLVDIVIVLLIILHELVVVVDCLVFQLLLDEQKHDILVVDVLK